MLGARPDNEPGDLTTNVPRIRKAEARDIESVVHMRLLFLHEFDRSGNEDEAASLEASTREYVSTKLPTGEFSAWLVEAEGRPVGVGGLILWQRPPTLRNPSGLDGYVVNVYTLKEWRGQGIASALMEEIIRYATERGAMRVRLHTTDAGMPLYRKLGFELAGNYMELRT